MSQKKKICIITAAALAVLTAAVFLIAGLVNPARSGPGYAEIYTVTGREQLDIVSDFFGFEEGRITDIGKIVAVGSWDGGSIYFFTTVDWPDLWEDFPDRDSPGNSIEAEHEMYPDPEDPSGTFTYDLRREYTGHDGKAHVLFFYRLFDDSRAVIQAFHYGSSQLWDLLEPSLTDNTVQKGSAQ